MKPALAILLACLISGCADAPVRLTSALKHSSLTLVGTMPDAFERPPTAKGQPSNGAFDRVGFNVGVIVPLWPLFAPVRRAAPVYPPGEGEAP